MPIYTGFGSWSALQVFIRAGNKVFYQGPMDIHPHEVYTREFKNGKLRVTPAWPARDTADPFTADEYHLPRFKRLA